jgi:type I restriction enzyme S subunit
MHGVEFLGQVESLKGQTDMADYVNLADQRQMAITLPPLPEQRAIADVLSSLDDKIDLLHRQNKTLESIAETLFRQWFIEEAQPVWEDGFIVDLFILQRGFDLPATQREPGHVPIVAASGHNGVHLHSQVKAPGVVTGRSGVIGSVFYVQEDFWPLNTTLWIKEFKKGTPLYSFYVLKNLDLEAMNAGSAVPTLNRNHVHLIHQKVPPKELMKEFEDIAAVHYKKIHSNQTQIRTLEKLRDSLLPKLMSGEVSIC